MKDDGEPVEPFAYWSGYAPARNVGGREQPLSALQLRAEAARFRAGAQRFELAADSAKATHLSQAADDMERRAADLENEQSPGSV
jgi:hypothetical protein